MANGLQSGAARSRRYAGSALARRNEKLKRAAQLAPVREGDAGCEKFAGSRRIMTAADYVADGDAVGEQIDAGREPHLLVRDAYNDGEFLPVAIHDVAIAQERGLCGLDVHCGPVLVKPDTLVYWK